MMLRKSVCDYRKLDSQNPDTKSDKCKTVESSGPCVKSTSLRVPGRVRGPIGMAIVIVWW